ncbi:hypothetical protein [Phytohabitans aurantiacus]|jgi:hypothetical protein|uniref:DUF4175 domain-containing protein n=1 Tax=Phytohabitans aurantiacus TaxID=3016789 RepID=A0ABQ5R0H1_9ACTN|nr:hypothetical protein [Phytohabitans aurantiacus]GLH99449.1 hypothetical protein Pa4123_47250 [Phytohabitans aurantiacus]
MESNNVEPLVAIAEARSALADRLITPWWYHPALGLLLAGYVVGMGLGNLAVKLAAAVLFTAGCLALGRAYRRLTGVWISGFDAGRAGRWGKALGALVGTAAISAWMIEYLTELTWPVWCLAVVSFAGAVILGRRFDDALRAQLRAGV